MNSQEQSQQSLQRLFLRRFAMALFCYGLLCGIGWLATLVGLLRLEPLKVLVVLSVLGGSQLVFMALFLSNLNVRFKDPSLTLPQVLVGLTWVSMLLAVFYEARGSLLVLYCQVLLFGFFQLTPRVFSGCALFAFAGFVAANLYDLYAGQPHDGRHALIQRSMLVALLVWLSVFSGYIYALRARTRQRRGALRASQDTLKGMMRQLEDLAATDELTGLFNRRHFLGVANRAVQCMPSHVWYGLALIDLDNFKRINDAHGHCAGDRVLQLFAAVAQTCLREGDVLARYGGEEFVLLLPEADADQLSACCERLRQTFNEAAPVGMSLGELSLSVGMTLLGRGDDLDLALQRADQALYCAKREGRNRCAANWGNVIA